MKNIADKTIGQIVTEDYRTAQVFEKHGLDFCCGGRRTVMEACAAKGIDPEALAREIAMLGSRKSTGDNYKDWTPDFLIDYIINNHHNYVRNKLPELHIYAEKVAKVHGKNHPENVEILDRLEELASAMRDHMRKEEEILFPYVKQLVESERRGVEPEAPEFGSAGKPVQMFEEEHEEAGEAMEEIRRLSNNFTVPDDACTTYEVLYQNLSEFRDDLHKHVHLENNILFPKALELEKRLI
ncbi:MAG: iron-sulfur cluster repair di-iron protein [Balneolaceae bacterium]|nr:iron-sulfur cluster repair di-iron protein [Balneolaceae bacterium]